MNVAEWIIVAILSLTLMVFLIMGIVLLAKLIGVSKEIEKIALHYIISVTKTQPT